MENVRLVLNIQDYKIQGLVHQIYVVLDRFFFWKDTVLLATCFKKYLQMENHALKIHVNIIKCNSKMEHVKTVHLLPNFKISCVNQTRVTITKSFREMVHVNYAHLILECKTDFTVYLSTVHSMRFWCQMDTVKLVHSTHENKIQIYVELINVVLIKNYWEMDNVKNVHNIQEELISIHVHQIHVHKVKL